MIMTPWLLAFVVIVLSVGVALGQGNDFAADVSCARWLHTVAGAKGTVLGWEEGWMDGYAAGIMSAIDSARVRRVRPSSIKDVRELVIGITSVCAASPQKRLVDVTLHLLGYR